MKKHHYILYFFFMGLSISMNARKTEAIEVTGNFKEIAVEKQNQAISVLEQEKKDILRLQINELAAKRNFVEESACPQREDILIKYQANSDKLHDILNILMFVYNTPRVIEKDRIKKEGEKSITYISTNLLNVLVKRYGVKISMAGIVSDNATIPVGAKLLTESFTLKEKEIEVTYRITADKIYLIQMQAIYPDKTRVYIDLTAMPQSDFRVYNTTEYGSEFKNLQVYFDSQEIGKIRSLQISNYELYSEKYTEWPKDTPNQGIVKYRYAVRCLDDNGNVITPTQEGKSIVIEPKTRLLWYTGTIGKYPVKAMLKTVKDEGEEGYGKMELLYGYEKHKKWISFDLYENSENAIIASKIENENTVEEWQMDYTFNSTLKGEWFGNNQELPIALSPMYKEMSGFTFKAQIKEELTPSGEVSNQSISAIDVYQEEKKVQQFKFEYALDLEYFTFAYVDINYDNYLDLIIEDNYYLYNPQSKKFTISDNEDDYFAYLTELGQYNLFNKSYIQQMNRSMIEYRAVKGKILPYHASSYFVNVEGDMVMLEEDYVNGKWVVVEERIDKLEEYESKADEVDTAAPENYALSCDLEVSNGKLLFTPIFYNKTGVAITFKQKAKLYVELVDSNGKVYKQFLHDVALNSGESYMLNDNYIQYTGEAYFLSDEKGLLPFFPIGINQGEYTCSIVLEHELFGTIKTESRSLGFPLGLEKDENIEHYKGSINNKVFGSIYMLVNGKQTRGTFINAKSGKSIALRGVYLLGVFDNDTVLLEEHELSDGELSGYFEGTIDKDNNDGPFLFNGYWLSPDKTTTRLPFQFKKQ